MQIGLVLLAIVGPWVATAAGPPATPDQGSAQGQKPATGLVVGQVVDAVTGRGMGESVVTLTFSQPGAPQSPAAREAASRKVITDGDGWFVFGSLVAGRYGLTATRPGFVSAAYGKLVPRGPGVPLELSEGERLIDLRLLVWEHAAITGRVADERGDAVVGAQVKVLRKAAYSGRAGFTEAATVTTDDRGIYCAGALEPGTYVVGVPSVATTLPARTVEAYVRSTGANRAELQRALIAAAPTMTGVAGPGTQQVGDYLLQVDGRMPLPAILGDDATLMYPSSYHAAAGHPRDAALLAIGSGEVRSGIDIPLRPVRAVRVSGVLEGPGGAVGHAAIHLVAVGPPGDVGMRLDTVATTVADSAGAFVFVAVPPGTYELRVLKLPSSDTRLLQSVEVRVQGNAVTRGVGEPSSPPPEATLWARQVLTVADRDIGDMRVPLHTGFRLTGRVEFEGSTPSLSPGQRITPFLESSDDWYLADISEMRTADDGTFVSYEAPPGTYRLTVPVPSGWFVKRIWAGGRDLPDLPFELKDNLTDVVITLSAQGAAMTGTVRRPDGAPDTEAVVVLFPADQRQWVGYSAYARGIRDLRTSRDGTFRLTDLPGGEYFVAAVPQTAVDWTRPAFLESLSRVSMRVTLAEGEARSMDLRTVQVK